MLKAYPRSKPPSGWSLLTYLRVFLVVFLFVAPFAVPKVLAQDSTAGTQANDEDSADDKAPSVMASAYINDNRGLWLYVGFDSGLEHKYDFPKIFSEVYGCQLRDADVSHNSQSQFTSINTFCKAPIQHSFLTRSGTFNLQPIRSIQNADPDFTFSFDLSFSDGTFARCLPAGEPSEDSDEVACEYFFNSTATTPAAIHYEFGYQRAYALRLVAILGFLLLVPVALTFWFRRRASTAPEEAKPAVSFAYRRFLTRLLLLGSLIWWAALDLLKANEFVAFILPTHWGRTSDLATVLPWFLLWIPPAIVYFTCLALSSPMHNLRGTNFTQGEILNRAFWSVARLVVPMSLIVLGLTESSSNERIGLPLVIAGFASVWIINAKFLRAHGMEFYALTTSELRDRAFAIAEKAKTKLNQLYVFPMSAMRIANAFAHGAKNVFLTDYLVHNLSKSEVDAVVGHEIAHLQKKHIGLRIAVTIFLLASIGSATGLLDSVVPRNFPTGPVMYAILLLIIFFISRRNEFAADAGSAKLTGNTEAMMTALARITRLNTMPLQWSKLDEKLLTHPSTLRRINRLAAEAGISEARTAELLAQSALPPHDTYSIPATALPAGKIFSTRYKTQLNWKIAWSIIVVSIIVPAVTASVVRWAGFGGSTRWSIYVLGFLLTLAADRFLLDVMPMLSRTKLERRFREKCRLQNQNPSECAGTFVGLAPDSYPRIYEGNWSWDIGLLSITPDELTYWGEEARFILRRDQITSISVGPGAAGWFRSPAIYFSWHDSSGSTGTFHICALSANSMRQMGRKTHLLMRDLENWLNRTPAAVNPTLAVSGTTDKNAGPPAFGPVTGMSPRTAVRGRLLARDFLLNSILAIAAILVFGLSFPLLDGSCPCPSSVDVNAALGGIYVLVTVWLTRALILAPYWRFQDQPSSPPKQAPHTP
jgi:Zn-dependent protease with chaperone function